MEYKIIVDRNGGIMTKLAAEGWRLARAVAIHSLASNAEPMVVVIMERETLLPPPEFGLLR